MALNPTPAIFTLGLILSPTRMVADIIKNCCQNDCAKRCFLNSWNKKFFYASIIIGPTIFILDQILELSELLVILAPVSVLAFYRCNEILFAFAKDPFEQIAKGNHNLAFRQQRLILVIRSFGEVAINFSFIHYFINLFCTKPAYGVEGICNYFDALYFSIITITTTGYGDISPTVPVSKFLSAQEVVTGLILIVVSLSTYMSLNVNENIQHEVTSKRIQT